MGQGGVCEIKWCKKENRTQAQPKPIFFNLQPVCQKMRVSHTDSNILILGLSSKTHNTKNVEHQETNPDI